MYCWSGKPGTPTAAAYRLASWRSASTPSAAARRIRFSARPRANSLLQHRLISSPHPYLRTSQPSAAPTSARSARRGGEDVRHERADAAQHEAGERERALHVVLAERDDAAHEHHRRREEEAAAHEREHERPLERRRSSPSTAASAGSVSDSTADATADAAPAAAPTASAAAAPTASAAAAAAASDAAASMLASAVDHLRLAEIRSRRRSAAAEEERADRRRRRRQGARGAEHGSGRAARQPPWPPSRERGDHILRFFERGRGRRATAGAISPAGSPAVPAPICTAFRRCSTRPRRRFRSSTSRRRAAPRSA